MAEEVGYPTLSQRRRCPAIVRTGTKRIVYRREDLGRCSSTLEPAVFVREERGQRLTCYGPSTSHDTMSCNARTASAIGVPTARIATANAITTTDASANARTSLSSLRTGDSAAPGSCGVVGIGGVHHAPTRSWAMSAAKTHGGSFLSARIDRTGH